MTGLFFEEVSCGDEMPSRLEVFDPARLFFFSASTFNGHRIHYDWRYATEIEGFQDLVVHGSLQAALIFRSLTAWMGPQGRIVRFSTKSLGQVLMTDALKVSGRVIGLGEDQDIGLVEIEMAAERQRGHSSIVTMPASAGVMLPLKSLQ